MKNHQLMRATLEELAPLRWLWQRVGFTTVELEKSLTDFYLLIDEDHNLLAALAVQFRQKDAFLHHLAFSWDDPEEALQMLLWERLKILLTNRGVHRVWTREVAPSWKQTFFQKPTAEQSSLAPELSTPKQPGLQVHLTRDPLATKLIEKKLAELAAEREISDQQLASRTLWTRRVAYALSFLFIAWLMYFTLRGFFALPRLR